MIQFAHVDEIQIGVTLLNEFIPGCGCEEEGSVVDDKALSFPEMCKGTCNITADTYDKYFSLGLYLLMV